MPCCLAILAHNCGHKQLWKISCTSSCTATTICPRRDQEVLALLKYKWRCEDCHTRQWDQHERLRGVRFEAQEQRVADDPDTTHTQKDLEIDALRVKENWMDHELEQRRTEQVEEIQSVAEFAEEYGHVVWRFKYGPEDGIQDARRRLDYLYKAKFWDVEIVRDASREEAVVARSRSGSAVPAADAPQMTAKGASLNQNGQVDSHDDQNVDMEDGEVRAGGRDAEDIDLDRTRSQNEHHHAAPVA